MQNRSMISYANLQNKQNQKNGEAEPLVRPPHFLTLPLIPEPLLRQQTIDLLHHLVQDSDLFNHLCDISCI